VNNAVEGALPPKFCWRIQSSEKECNNPDYEYHFTSCKLKCNTGYERFGFHCRKACTDKELNDGICKYTWAKSKIAYKVPPATTFSPAETRWLKSAANTYSPPKDTSKDDSGYITTCPKDMNVDTKFWKTTCKPIYNYNCKNIGYEEECAVKGCAITKTDCYNFKADLTLSTIVAVLKITSIFIAPGTGYFINAVAAGV
jgi:hypothetical protein